MFDDDDFKPKLGKIRSRGAKGGRKFLHRVLAASNLARGGAGGVRKSRFADSAYRSRRFSEVVRAKGGTVRVVATGMWGRDEAETRKRLADFNRPIHRVRARIEKIFGTYKRSYGLRRMRWRGLAKATLQVHLTAIAYNLKRARTITSNATA